MLVTFSPPVKGTRKPIGKSNEASVWTISGTSTRYDGMVERLQPVVSRPIDQDFGIIIPPYCHLLRPSSSFYHVSRFLALKAAKALFPDNIVDARELRMFMRDGVQHAATYSGFVSDDNGAVQRHAESMRRFYETEFASRQEEMEFIAKMDRVERAFNPELNWLPDAIRVVGLEPNHPEANYHLSNGKTVFFEINSIDLVKAAEAALDAGAAGKPAMEAVAAIYALLVHLEARYRVWSRVWYGQDDAERRTMKENYECVAYSSTNAVYELVFSLLSDIRDASVIKMPDVFIRMGLLQTLMSMACTKQMSDNMGWGAPAQFPVESGVIDAMDNENHEIRKQKQKVRARP